MKKMLSLILVLGLLVCTFGFNSISAEPASQTARILAANPDYRVMTASTGEERILDAENMVINQIIANVDQILDVEAYNNGEIDNFFGIDFVEIKPLFQEAWVDAIVEQIGYKFSYLVTIPFGSDIENVIETLESNEHISAVSQNSYSELENSSVYDEDTAITTHFENIGVSYAWEHGFTGSSDTRVSIVDTGVAHHEEFDNNMEFTWGFNACFDSDYPQGTSAEDTIPFHPTFPGHGNFVAGIIGADYGDGGVNGICQDITMFAVKVGGYADQFQQALSYSYFMGAKVLNISWDIPANTQLDAIIGSDVLVVTSAGNDGVEITPNNSYVKCNDLPNFIVVGNSDANDEKASDSNYSKIYVDLFAPGHTLPGVNYPSGLILSSGTSFAAPMVAGAAALIRSHATHLTAAQTKDLILNNVDVIPALANYCVTGGRLAIDKAVNALYNEDRTQYKEHYSKGDINDDGEITAMDKMLAQRIAYGTMTATSDQFYAADVNKDNVVNTTDVDMILGFYYSTCYFPPV